jgi:hypothetical protein
VIYPVIGEIRGGRLKVEFIPQVEGELSGLIAV